MFELGYLIIYSLFFSISNILCTHWISDIEYDMDTDTS